jgi:hypothetical protein
MIYIPILVFLIYFVITVTYHVHEYSLRHPDKEISKKWRKLFPPEELDNED